MTTEYITNASALFPITSNGHVAMSPTIAQLATALAKAQGAMEGAKKDSTNPHFRSKYADLASVWDAIRAPLSVNELSVVQLPQDGPDGAVTIITILLHSSGEWIRSDYSMPAPKWDPHGVGTAITYGRRYALAAIVGIAPEDDDGNAATQSVNAERQSHGKPGEVFEAPTKAIKSEIWQCAKCKRETFSDRVKPFKAKHENFPLNVKVGDLMYRCECGQFVPARPANWEADDEKLPAGMYGKDEK